VHEGARGEAELGLLSVEVEHRLLDRPDGPGARSGASVQDPVDGRGRQAGLLSDVAQAV